MGLRERLMEQEKDHQDKDQQEGQSQDKGGKDLVGETSKRQAESPSREPNPKRANKQSSPGMNQSCPTAYRA